MNRAIRCILVASAALILAPPAIVSANERQEPTKKPNIILILTDDQGYGDISAHGNPVLKTPHLDKLRGDSVRFTDFHVSPTCSPTRSALMTGRHEFKNGVTHTILERERLTLKATTVAQVLQSAGYTTGIFGKWHLGDEAEYQPHRRGFDEVFIHGCGGIGQTFPGSCGDAPGNKYFDPAILHNGKFERTTGYCTDVFYAQATKWIDTQRQAKRPFFAYIPSNAPHAPYIAKPEDKALYEGKGLAADTESFFGMIHNIDQNVGKLLARLDEWGIANDTLVIFMNDNGGTAGVKVFNAGMRGAKVTAWLGGTRACSFWRWPGTLKPADCGALAAHIDIFPTLVALTGAKIPDDVKPQVEGRSLVPLLKNPTAQWADRYLFSHQGRWPKFADPNESKFRMAAVRNTRWALVSEKGGREPNWQLFDLQTDYAQQHDVLAQHPEVVKELGAAFDKWWGECLPLMVNEKAVGPTINPFQTLYYQQFGGSPTPQDLNRMNPNRPAGKQAPKRVEPKRGLSRFLWQDATKMGMSPSNSPGDTKYGTGPETRAGYRGANTAEMTRMFPHHFALRRQVLHHRHTRHRPCWCRLSQCLPLPRTPGRRNQHTPQPRERTRCFPRFSNSRSPKPYTARSTSLIPCRKKSTPPWLRS